MATVIDSLLMTLGMDGANFQKGKQQATADMDELRKQADKTAKELAAKGKDAAKFFVELRNQAISMFAVFTAGKGLKNFIEDTTEATATLGLFAKNINTATQTVNAWMNATELAGGTGEGFQGTLSMLSRSMTEMQVTGQSAILPYLRALGVNMADAAGHARPLDDVLLDLADRFTGMDRATANNIGRMMGIDQDTLNLILMGRKAVEEMIRKQKELHLVTKEDGEQAMKLKQTFIDLRQAAGSTARDIMSAITPALISMFEALKSAVAWMSEHKDFVIGFITTFAVVLTARLIPALIRAAVAMWALIAPVALVVGAVLLLSAAVALLWDDFQTWKKGGDNLLPWDKMAKGANFVIGVIDKLRNALSDAWDLITKLASAKLPWFLGGGEKQDDPNAQGQAKEQLLKMGWSPAQTNGILANLMTESGLDPTAEGDNGLAYGLAQWHPDRQEDFRKWAGKDIRGSSASEQLAFMNHELRQGKWKKAGTALAGATTDRAAAEVFSNQYEIPLDTAGEAARRGDLAAQLAARSLASPNPSAMASAAPAGARVNAAQGGSVSTSTSTSETNIGQVIINTEANDAKGIAKDFKGAMQSGGLAYQSDSGLS